MSLSPRRKDITLRDNQDFKLGFGFKEPGGRGITDLVIEDGSTSATSATAAFTTGDTGRKLVVVDGNGIVDGTTMEYVSPTEVTLSAAATADRSGVTAVVRALNTSAYASLGAQVRNPDNIDRLILALTVDAARKAVGIWELTAAREEIKAKVRRSGLIWDWLVQGPEGDGPWYAGLVTFERGATRGV